jgi:hypothetical protein
VTRPGGGKYPKPRFEGSGGFALIKRGDFRNERGAQSACLFIVAAFKIGHACRETIPGAFKRRRPEKIWLGYLACHWFILLQFPMAYGRHFILTYMLTIVK